jgi:hypothetical protein
MGWIDARFAQRIIDMAVWMLDEENILYSTKNM